MKKITLIVVSFFLLIGTNVKAQHDLDINAAGIFYKNFGIDYEYIIKDQMGAGLSLTYAQNTLGMKLDDGVDFSAFEIVPEFKFYPNPSNGGDKMYIGGYIKYKSATWKDMSYQLAGEDEELFDMSYSGVAVGFNLGYKMIFASGFFVEASAGAGRFLITNWDDTGDAKLKLSDAENDTRNNTYADNFMFNWDVRFALGLGWRFGGE